MMLLNIYAVFAIIFEIKTTNIDSNMFVVYERILYWRYSWHIREYLVFMETLL